MPFWSHTTYKAQIFPEKRPASLAINGFACSGGVKRTANEVLSNVVRPKHKGPFTSTDGKYRNFTDDAAAKLRHLVDKNADDITNGETFVGSCDGGVVLACVFYSLPTKVLSARGYQEALLKEECMRRGWFYGSGSKVSTVRTSITTMVVVGALPAKDVAKCGWSAWFTGGPTEVVAEVV
jgi:hypothetical protein